MKRKFVVFILLFIGISINMNAQTWTQIGNDIYGEATYNRLGWSVSLSADGSVVAMGAYWNDNAANDAGNVVIYENQSGTWTQIGNSIDGEAADDQSGYSVSLNADGSIVAIGAPYNDGNGSSSGHVRIFENQSGTWTQIGSDIDGVAGNYSGWSVSLSADGSIVAIGGTGEYPTNGQVRIYENQSGTWTQIGSDIDGDGAIDKFGCSVSLSADGFTVAIGAYGDDDGGGDAGHVRIYENQSGTWTQIGSDINGKGSNYWFGWSVSLSADGSIVAIGGPGHNNTSTTAGYVQVYENQSGTWTQIGNDINGETIKDRFGCSVSLSNDGAKVAIGAYWNDDSGNDAGYVQIYKNQSDIWTQIGDDINGDAANDWLGYSVSLSANGSNVAIGAYGNDGGGTTSGQVQVYTGNSYATINPTACDTYTVPSGDETYVSSGTYYDTVPNTLGCDSIITINLAINYSNTGTDVITACDSYTWIDGNTYTSSNNTATHTLENINGCDSVVTLNLTINYSNTGTDVITACDSYTWIDGNTYTLSNNTATHTLENIHGCDSVVTLDLTINYSNTGTDVVTACDSYTWIDGNTYTSSNNTATHTLENIYGCDSVVTLDLTINYSNTGTDVITACDSYTWIDGNIYTSSNNTATHTLENVHGCDSVITLDLTINYSNTGTDVITACGSYIWIDGNTYTSSNNTATYTLENIHGCDSVVTLDLTINYSNTGTDVLTACDSYTWIDGITYTSSNNTATHTLENIHGCDSLVTLDLTINTVDASVTENGLTLTANANEANYQWINCGNDNIPIEGEAGQSFTANESGSYAVIVDNGLCADTSMCYTVTVTGINRIENNSIDIYPNPTNGIIEIGLVENKISKISILDISGKKIIEKIPGAQNETIDLSGFGNGLYIIMVETDKKIYTAKIIKE